MSQNINKMLEPNLPESKSELLQPLEVERKMDDHRNIGCFEETYEDTFPYFSYDQLSPNDFFFNADGGHESFSQSTLMDNLEGKLPFDCQNIKSLEQKSPCKSDDSKQLQTQRHETKEVEKSFTMEASSEIPRSFDKIVLSSQPKVCYVNDAEHHNGNVNLQPINQYPTQLNQNKNQVSNNLQPAFDQNGSKSLKTKVVEQFRNNDLKTAQCMTPFCEPKNVLSLVECVAIRPQQQPAKINGNLNNNMFSIVSRSKTDFQTISSSCNYIDIAQRTSMMKKGTVQRFATNSVTSASFQHNPDTINTKKVLIPSVPTIGLNNGINRKRRGRPSAAMAVNQAKMSMLQAQTTNGLLVCCQFQANRVFVCSFCPEIFSSHELIKQHALLYHHQHHPYKCLECQVGFLNRFNNNCYQYFGHNCRNSAQLECKRCQRFFPSWNLLAQHAAYHTDQDQEYEREFLHLCKSYRCRECLTLGTYNELQDETSVESQQNICQQEPVAYIDLTTSEVEQVVKTPDEELISYVKPQQENVEPCIPAMDCNERSPVVITHTGFHQDINDLWDL